MYFLQVVVIYTGNIDASRCVVNTHMLPIRKGKRRELDVGVAAESEHTFEVMKFKFLYPDRCLSPLCCPWTHDHKQHHLQQVHWWFLPIPTLGGGGSSSLCVWFRDLIPLPPCFRSIVSLKGFGDPSPGLVAHSTLLLSYWHHHITCCLQSAVCLP